MKPIDFPGRETILGAPADWDEAQHGPCEGLPIIRQDGACVSLWEATPEERAAIAAGANIWLHVHSGRTQPPVGLAVGKAPEPDAAATYEAPRDPAAAVRVRGVGRVADEPRALLLMLTERPTDDELRALHEFFSGRPMLEALRQGPHRDELDDGGR